MIQFNPLLFHANQLTTANHDDDDYSIHVSYSLKLFQSGVSGSCEEERKHLNACDSWRVVNLLQTLFFMVKSLFSLSHRETCIMSGKTSLPIKLSIISIKRLVLYVYMVIETVNCRRDIERKVRDVSNSSSFQSLLQLLV